MIFIRRFEISAHKTDFIYWDQKTISGDFVHTILRDILE